MDSFATHDEVLIRSEFPFIFLSAFYSLDCTTVQPTDISSVPNSHSPWGCSSELNHNPCPCGSHFVVVETHSEHMEECGDAFMRTNRREVGSLWWGKDVLDRVARGSLKDNCSIWGKSWRRGESDHVGVGLGEGATGDVVCAGLAWWPVCLEWSEWVRRW